MVAIMGVSRTMTSRGKSLHLNCYLHTNTRPRHVDLSVVLVNLISLLVARMVYAPNYRESQLSGRCGPPPPGSEQTNIEAGAERAA